MRLIMVTGMSGSGKSHAMNALEDMGFEAIDNVPLRLLPALVEGQDVPVKALAIGVDVRSRDFTTEGVVAMIRRLRRLAGVTLDLLYIDCDDAILQRRYTETRRKHPLALDRQVADGIAHERSLTRKIKNMADLVLDTSEMELADLKRVMQGHFAEGNKPLSLFVTSFSYRQGLPREADLVFDVRFLKNPHYDPLLKPLTGQQPEVGAYIESDPGFAPFFAHLRALLEPLLPRYREEGKSYLTLAIGCTGGKHRSVFLAEKLAGFLQEKGYKVALRHRDLKTIPARLLRKDA